VALIAPAELPQTMGNGKPWLRGKKVAIALSTPNW
jgi:hypothetical protein